MGKGLTHNQQPINSFQSQFILFIKNMYLSFYVSWEMLYDIVTKSFDFRNDIQLQIPNWHQSFIYT